MSSPVNDTIPSQQSVHQVQQIPLTQLDMPDYDRDCCVKSIISRRNGHFTYSLTFGGSCSGWEGRVQVPVIRASPDVREAWNRHMARFAPNERVVEAMEFLGKIIELGQKPNGTQWYKRAFRVEIEDYQYDGHVFTRRDNVRTMEQIQAARHAAAKQLDQQRDEASAVRSVEAVPTAQPAKTTFVFAAYPSAGRAAEVTADGIHGYDLARHRVAVTATRKTDTTRDVRFRCVLPPGYTHWYEGSLTGDMRSGRFVEIEEP
ncbi:hypothetical protein Slin15195_G127110 [Septoria linicola]|uniref:Uncharacterized protein n=1 Tax=Septoria linicola TaxID=215465 RepID=A0A9Q9B0E3_9PEZI|nr:hypothetical protein Slin15195_G127110 [Septoria linicola]